MGVSTSRSFFNVTGSSCSFKASGVMTSVAASQPFCKATDEQGSSFCFGACAALYCCVLRCRFKRTSDAKIKATNLKFSKNNHHLLVPSLNGVRRISHNSQGMFAFVYFNVVYSEDWFLSFLLTIGKKKHLPPPPSNHHVLFHLM